MIHEGVKEEVFWGDQIADLVWSDPNYPSNIDLPKDINVLAKSRENMHPSGHRSPIVNNTDIYGSHAKSFKGLIVPDVNVYGDISAKSFNRTREWLGVKTGVLPFVDATQEILRFSYLAQANPSLLSDYNAPIWKPIAIYQKRGFAYLNGWDGKIFEKPREIQMAVLVTRIPYLSWRGADCYLDNFGSDTQEKLQKLMGDFKVDTLTDLLGIGFERIAKAASYYWEAKTVHSNLYWKEKSEYQGLIYARPNLHNINLDFSVGDDDEGATESETKSSRDLCFQTISMYASASLIASGICGNSFQECPGIARSFYKSLPTSLIMFLQKEKSVPQVKNEYHNRRLLIEKGYKVKDGIEFFSDTQFLVHEPFLQTCLDSLQKLLDQSNTKELVLNWFSQGYRFDNNHTNGVDLIEGIHTLLNK